jgi:hypothetical protein
VGGIRKLDKKVKRTSEAFALGVLFVKIDYGVAKITNMLEIADA